jgi:PAS domain S-box-containing protein
LTDEATFRAVFEHAPDAILILDGDGRILDANPAVASVLGVARERLIGRRPEDLAPAHKREALVELRRSLRERGRVRAEYEYESPDGERRWLEYSASANFLDGRDLTIVRDCTRSHRIQAALEAQSLQKATLAQLSLLALRGAPTEDLLREAASGVATALSVERAAILEPSPGGEAPRVRARAGRETLEDASSRVSVTIQAREADWGSLEVGDGGRRFDEHDLDFLRAVANTLGLAIDAARDHEELQRRSEEIHRLAAQRQRIAAQALAAEDRARERISQQLHDGLLQSLFVIRQDLAALAARPPADPALLVRARDGVADAIHSLRAAVFDLHPVVLERGGLRAAVNAVARHHAQLGGFRADVRVEPEVEGEHDRLLLSLVRELLANVAEHAGAATATVAVRRDGHDLVLEVIDDGRGVDPLKARLALSHGHIGLASAAQRIEALDGRFELTARPGGGTIARAVIPSRPSAGA